MSESAGVQSVVDEEWWDELLETMEGCPVADNHGRAAIFLAGSHNDTHVNLADARLKMDGVDHLHRVPDGDESFYGLVTHRGVLSEEEEALLDWSLVERLVSEVDLLGVPLDEVAKLYHPGAAGRPSQEESRKKVFIDERLLSIQEAGGNMNALAAILGWHIDGKGKCQIMQRALVRASKVRENKNKL